MEEIHRDEWSDKIAALYLQDRDLKCPSCSYNRRGSASAACPECGCVLLLKPARSDKAHARLWAALRTFVRAMLAFGVIMFVWDAATWYEMFTGVSFQDALLFIDVLSVVHSVFVVSILFTWAHAEVCVRTDAQTDSMSGRTLNSIRLGSWLLAAYSALTCFLFFAY